MADNGQKHWDLEDRLDVYAAWVKELSGGKSTKPPPTDAADPLARLGRELQHLSDVITRRESELSRLFQVVHKVERGLLVEDVLDRIFEGFSGILPYDRIGCGFLSDGGARLTAHWALQSRAAADHQGLFAAARGKQSSASVPDRRNRVS